TGLGRTAPGEDPPTPAAPPVRRPPPPSPPATPAAPVHAPAPVGPASASASGGGSCSASHTDHADAALAVLDAGFPAFLAGSIRIARGHDAVLLGRVEDPGASPD
ncbi:hypothetical protein, partial [Blastococcus sp. MG754426]